MSKMMQFPGQVCSFLKRHRRKFIFAGVLVGGVIGSVKYAQYKVKEWMAQEEKKYLEELRKQQHFEKTQEHCFAIAEAVIKSLKEEILTVVDTETITNSLKVEKNAEKKLELWGELKISVFTKVASSIYILTLVAAIIRLQLNHLSAKVFFASSNQQQHNIDDITQRWFLSLCHEFVSKNGLEYFVQEMRQICGDLTDSMPLQCGTRGADIEALMKSVHDRIKRHSKLRFQAKVTDDDSSVLDFLIPSHTPETGLKNVLVDEMWDIFDSDDCMRVFETCLFQVFHGFCRIIDNAISDSVGATSSLVTKMTLSDSGMEPQFLPLAKLLPILNSQVQALTSERFLRKTLANDILTRFSANVYESFTS